MARPEIREEVELQASVAHYESKKERESLHITVQTVSYQEDGVVKLRAPHPIPASAASH